MSHSIVPQQLNVLKDATVRAQHHTIDQESSRKIKTAFIHDFYPAI
ncbi:hypothetical protein [Chitinophaga sp.]